MHDTLMRTLFITALSSVLRTAQRSIKRYGQNIFTLVGIFHWKEKDDSGLPGI